MNMLKRVEIPFIELNDENGRDSIHELARNTAQNLHIDVAENIRSNPNEITKYPFLLDKSSLEYRYYAWKVISNTYSLTNDQERRILDKYVSIMTKSPPGGIDLIEEDKQYFNHLLSNNPGSKDKVKAIRRWALDRSHSMIAIGILLMRYVEQQARNPNTFESILHAIYVINDILFNGSHATMNGVYLRGIASHDISFPTMNIFQCLFLRLGSILKLAYDCSATDIDRQKLYKIIELWQIKEFINDIQKKGLENQMIGMIPNFPAPAPPLISPIESIRTALTQNISSTTTTIESTSTHSSNHVNISATSTKPIPPPPPPPPIPPYSYNLAQSTPQPPSYGYPPQPTIPQSHPFPHAHCTNHVPQLTPLATLPIGARIDLCQTSVGIMANITRASIAQGHPAYYPIDPLAVVTVSKPMEPGRLEARVEEFYKKLNDVR